jgi:hypothetical protein
MSTVRKASALGGQIAPSAVRVSIGDSDSPHHNRDRCASTRADYLRVMSLICSPAPKCLPARNLQHFQ